MLIKLLVESNAFERQRRDALPSIKASLSECLDIIDLGVDSSLSFFSVKLLRQSNIFNHFNIFAKSLQMEQKTRQIQQIRVREEGVSEELGKDLIIKEVSMPSVIGLALLILGTSELAGLL
jgi:hypothetical protein